MGVISSTLLSGGPERNVQGVRINQVAVMIKEPPGLKEAVYILLGPYRPGSPEYVVVHARAKGLLRSDPEAGATFTEAPIDEDVVKALDNAWGAMTFNARWPGETRIPSWGSTFYTFEFFGERGITQGWVSSPAPGTCAFALAEIGELLIRYADEPDAAKRLAIRADLLNRSHSLAARLGERATPQASKPAQTPGSR
jgi:hypothetical protein